MKVRATRKHSNSYLPQSVKNPGRVYDVPDREVGHLIAAKLVEPYHSEEALDEAVGQD